jgi:hypothetical protein
MPRTRNRFHHSGASVPFEVGFVFDRITGVASFSLKMAICSIIRVSGECSSHSFHEDRNQLIPTVIGRKNRKGGRKPV